MRKKKSRKRSSNDIIAIEGLDNNAALAESKLVDQMGLGMSMQPQTRKKKKRRKKKKAKSKDNIFASKQNMPHHNFPDLGHGGAQTTYNPSLAGTYDNFGGLGNTQNSFAPGIFDNQNNPTMRTNHAMMDSTDRFAPPQNSGAIRALQMHQSIGTFQPNLNANMTEKPRKKKRKRKKKKKGQAGIER
jgi:hypothetical protein